MVPNWLEGDRSSEGYEVIGAQTKQAIEVQSALHLATVVFYVLMGNNICL